MPSSGARGPRRESSRLSRRRIVWVFPNFEEALWSGQHCSSPRGAARRAAARVEARDAVIGEIDPARIRVAGAEPATRHPDLRGRPARADDGRGRARRRREPGRAKTVSTSTPTRSPRHSTWRPTTSRHGGPGQPPAPARARARPGQARARGGGHAGERIATLGDATGLPLHVLDPRAPLDLDDVRALLRAPRARTARGRRLPRRPDRPREGRADRPDQAARRLPLRRPDRHRQDGDREGVQRVPLRLAGSADPARHERVPDPGEPRAAPRRRDAKARGRRR